MPTKRTRYQAVLFDMDDTLLITAVMKWQHHKAVAKKFYSINLTDEELHEHWGAPFEQLVAKLYKNADSVENMIANFRTMENDFPKQIQRDTVMVINKLSEQGLKLGVVTAMSRDFSKFDLELVGVPIDKFLFIQGSDDTSFHKPDPRVFDPALAKLDELRIAKENVAYIGDTLDDCRAAQGAGLAFIGLTTGLTERTAFEQAGAPIVVDSLAGILPHIGL